ncbi:MAG: hypothetical protein Q7R41_17420 [Phycisphaerales bacterium]|nr:hypothetical protein [Phycisphaerales bacterium]
MYAAAWAEPPAKSEEPKAKAGVAAYIGGEAITLQDLDAIALKTNMKLAQSLYDARRAAIDQVIMERLLASEAAAQKITVEQLISKRIAEKIQPVTGADVETYYKANSARMGGKTIEQVSEQIQSFLTTQKEKVARDNLLGELKQKVEVKITLDAPRVEVPIAANDPAKGPKDAKVKVVVFSDFQ